MATAMSLKEMVDATFGNEEKVWPQNVALYQFPEKTQVLLPDFANSLATRAFLALCGLEYELETRSNADKMSPSGRVPFLHIGSQLIAEFEPIVKFVQSKYFDLSDELSGEQRLQLATYSALVQNTLAAAELYFTWQVQENVNQVSRPRAGSPFPWPLNVLLPRLQQRRARAELRARGPVWAGQDTDQVIRNVHSGLSALEQQLGESEYFFGERPSALDALVYGHVYAALTTRLPCDTLAQCVEQHPKLVRFAARLDERLFGS